MSTAASQPSLWTRAWLAVCEPRCASHAPDRPLVPAPPPKLTTCPVLPLRRRRGRLPDQALLRRRRTRGGSRRGQDAGACDQRVYQQPPGSGVRAAAGLRLRTLGSVRPTRASRVLLLRECHVHARYEAPPFHAVSATSPPLPLPRLTTCARTCTTPPHWELARHARWRRRWRCGAPDGHVYDAVSDVHSGSVRQTLVALGDVGVCEQVDAVLTLVSGAGNGESYRGQVQLL